MPIHGADSFVVRAACTGMSHTSCGLEGMASTRLGPGGLLNIRDIRRLMAGLSTGSDMSIAVRRHVILFNFDPLRCIVLWDRLIVLMPDGECTVLDNLEHNVKQASSQGQAFLDDIVAGEVIEAKRHGSSMDGWTTLMVLTAWSSLVVVCVR